MTTQDTLQHSGLEDLFFPDNANRKTRLEQLMAQCADYTNEIANNKEKIDKLIDMVDKAVKDAYSSIGIKNVPYEKVELVPGWVKLVPESLGLTAIFTATYKGISTLATKLSVSYLLKQGRIGEAALAKLVGLPKWFKFGRIAGSTAIAAIVTVGIEAIVDSIVGASIKAKLQNGIKEMVKPRIELYYTKLKSDRVLSILKSIINEVKRTKREAIKYKWTKEKLEEELQQVVRDTIEMEEDLNPAPTRMTALAGLKEKDKMLGAWTNEDPSATELESIVHELDGKENSGLDEAHAMIIAAYSKQVNVEKD
ncbi:hypothetical protein P5763_26385 [Bacillus cereus]|uniref:hypothetical protein n=1 Tax=Bacillus cereus group TaxID=86661 RepID=UPI001F581D1E|nr:MULTISPECIES: hypothetical protein [Bacillus cereus group]MDF9615525.1 hypothetical protein [Bacillus cereus]